MTENIAENDKLRSEYMRSIIQNRVPLETCSGPSLIPKVIIQFWHNLDDLPEDVQECINSWKILEHDGFDRILIDNTRAREFIKNEYGEPYISAYEYCHHPAMRCDYFRLCYLFKYGGFYLDADELYQGVDCKQYFQSDKLKIQPLCYDLLSHSMVSPEKFIDGKEFSENWIYYANNNPIISPSNHPIIRKALERSTSILLNSNQNLNIQSTTGPGNLSASIVAHLIDSTSTKGIECLRIIPDWNKVSISPWPLSYRNDKRNWRLWDNARNWKY
ncbi:MAG: glycosyltransferase family 32 protein [bacterium]